MDFKADLTKEQYAAVTHGEGAALVVAAPGSGKTRCITYRIAYLLQHGVDPHSILAITFTNKAAEEMRSRVAKMVPRSKAKKLWISTFHSLGARMLRLDYKAFGVPKNYSISDANTTKDYIVKAAVKALRIEARLMRKKGKDDPYNAMTLQSRISHYKQDLIVADDLDPEDHSEQYTRDIIKVYKEYQKALKRADMLDFDDLLMVTTLGLRRDEELRHKYASNFPYVMVDEYQDTNTTQYHMVRYLDCIHGNLFCVGDQDQAIYGWRGATIENIDKFLADYEGRVKTYLLQKNFRSFPPIADVANKVIVNNTKRIEKEVSPVRRGGKTVECVKCNSVLQEASFIADEIKAQVKAGKAKYRDFTLLYRVNSKSRALEEALRYRDIPSKIIGGIGFYDRAVVKDILAYLRMLANPNDDAALSRVHDKPPRGLGERGLGDLYELAEDKDCGAIYAIRRGWYKGKFNGRALSGIRDLKKLYKTLRGLPKRPVTPLMETVIEESGYRQMVRLKMKEYGEYDQDSHGPMAHLDELVRAAEAFDRMQGKSIVRFMEWTSLMQSTDEDTDDNRVKLMTCHAAKGLEFKNVYLVGCNEGVLPSSYSIEEDDVEEERRVFFVGVTRAEDNLTISYVEDINDTRASGEPSRFLDEADDTIKLRDISTEAIGSFTEWRVKSSRGRPGRRNYKRRGSNY